MSNNQYSQEFINYIKNKYKKLPIFLNHIQLLITALNEHEYAMKNDLVMEHIKKYLNIYKDLCN